MVKSFALLSFVGVVVLGSVNGAPIRMRREAAPAPVPAAEQPPQSLGRRFPQAEIPGLKAREPVAPIVPTTEEVTARRFPRRVYYEYYADKREPKPAADAHALHSEFAREPELVRPAVEVRAPTPEELAKSALDARNHKRSSRRSSDKDLYKRTLAKEGVKRRSPSEEPRSVKRSVTEAEEKRAYEEFKAKREPVVEEPKLDARALDALDATPNESRAFIPLAPAPVVARDTIIKESRAFVPPEPASHEAARRDSYTWNIHAGDDIIVDVSTPCALPPCTKKGKHGKDPKGSSSTSTKSPKSTPTGTKPPTDESTGTATSTSSASQSTETGSNPANAPPGGAQIPPSGGANGHPDTSSTSSSSSSTATSTKTSSSSAATGTAANCNECTTGGKHPKSGTADQKKNDDSKPPTVTDTTHPTPSPGTQDNHRRLQVTDTVLTRRESPKWTRMMPPAPDTPQAKRSLFQREYH